MTGSSRLYSLIVLALVADLIAWFAVPARTSPVPVEELVAGSPSGPRGVEAAVPREVIRSPAPHPLRASSPSTPQGRLPWPRQVPEALRPEVFSEEAPVILRHCEPGVRVREVDCTDPPCLLVASDERTWWWPMPWNQCPEWEARYGHTALTLYSTTVECSSADEQVLVFAPAQSWLEEHGHRREELSERFHERTVAIVQGWACGEEDGEEP